MLALCISHIYSGWVSVYVIYTSPVQYIVYTVVLHTTVIAPMQHILLLLQGEGTTFQTVIASNGEYTYVIIQFVSVESGLDEYDILATTGNDDLPYNSNPSKAGNGGTNPDVPGKYIIDLNGKQTIS